METKKQKLYGWNCRVSQIEDIERLLMKEKIWIKKEISKLNNTKKE